MSKFKFSEIVERRCFPFLNQDNQPYMYVPNRGYCASLRSPEVREWLLAVSYDELNTLPSAGTLESIFHLLEARALNDPATRNHSVNLRIAEHRLHVFPELLRLHLANPQEQFVEISPSGWCTTTAPRVHFESSRSALSIPAPLPASDPPGEPAPLDVLRSFLNVASRADWLRCLAWLLSTFRTSIPAPIAIFHGPLSSGKSIAARTLRQLIDPNIAPITPTPTYVRELNAHVRQNWLLLFDHIPSLSTKITGALCGLSSGAGISLGEPGAPSSTAIARHYRRPVLLTVTSQFECPPDLAERALAVNFAPLPAHQRQSLAALNVTFQKHYPRIVAAICDALSTALRRLPGMTLPTGRCADTLAWAMAAAPALDCTEEEMRQAIEYQPPDPTVEAVTQILSTQPAWSGTATQLLDLLPSNPHYCSARGVSQHLRPRLPALADRGVSVDFRAIPGGRQRLIHLTRHPPEPGPADPSAPSPAEPSPPPALHYHTSMGQYLAFDLGAESGRAISGTLSGGLLSIDELHRFSNTPVREGDSLYWDTARLWQEIRRGLEIANQRNLPLNGIGVDTWGVDFALLDAHAQLVEQPRHYRDPRTTGILEKLYECVPREEIFAYTGIQFMQINTLCQLYAMKLAGSPALAAARQLLNMPDLFNYWLTGVAKSESTIASTTQFFNPESMTWASELLHRLDLPTEILCALVPPGTPLGKMLEAPHIPVYATAGHDTASAVAAVPAQAGQDWCYISSGTWSLMGLEVDRPVLDDQALALNLTNEVGAGGRIRLLKNIAGLWLLQECRRAWKLEGHEYTYAQLTSMAAGARPFSAAIDPDAFLEPGEMPRKIAEYCRSKSQDAPATHAEYARAILESLALRYRHVLESLEQAGGRKIEVVHIVGGGSRNMLLNQFVADCTGRRVIAGPAEATAIGNILVQAMGAGELADLDQVRTVVRNSFAPDVVDPHPDAAWERAYSRYRAMVDTL